MIMRVINISNPLNSGVIMKSISIFYSSASEQKHVFEQGIFEKGKIYADVPLNYFDSLEALKQYTKSLKNMGVNVLLILPHFLPSFSAYVVKNYEKPCPLFNSWSRFSEFMLFVKSLGMDRMIDIPFNHADFNADNIESEWFVNQNGSRIEAGADDVDADNNKIRINWGAFILDNSNTELQNYWVEKVIKPHVQERHVNSIRIDAAWGLDAQGLKNIIQASKELDKDLWFLTENLGMAPLEKLARTSLKAGADRFFNNYYWYDGGLYIPSDVYKLYKRSNAAPACSIYSSHDVLMPAMKAYARIRSGDTAGLNDKAIVRLFTEYENTHSLSDIDRELQDQIVHHMKLDFIISTFLSSDLMFVAGTEKCLFKRTDVVNSTPSDFSSGIESDMPEFMKEVISIKHSCPMFNKEGVVIPFGKWKTGTSGIKGYLKSNSKDEHYVVAVNTDLNNKASFKLPKRMKVSDKLTIHRPEGEYQDSVTPEIELGGGEAVILSSKG